MLFREKMAWLSLVVIAVAFAPHFWAVTRFSGSEGALPFYSLGLFVAVVVAMTALMIAGAIGVAVSNPKEAEAPADERDRGVARRASAMAYAVLLPALFLALGIAFFGFGKAAVLNAVLAAIVLAELVRCGLEIVGYRRGW